MKFLALTLAAAVAVASPLVVKRAGPSGSLQFPQGGYSTGPNQALQIIYVPVNSQGQTTNKIDVELIDLSAGGTSDYPLAQGLSAASSTNNIVAYFNQIADAQGNNACGTFGLRITEYQTGPIYQGSFVAAQPTITIGC